MKANSEVGTGSIVKACAPGFARSYRLQYDGTTARKLFQRWGIAVLISVLGNLALAQGAAAKPFSCSGGDVTCVIAAVNAANLDGKEHILILSPGTYTFDAGIADPRGPVALPPIYGKLTIKGEGAESTVIERSSSAETFRFLTVYGSLSLDGVTMRGGGGQGAVDGGAILAIGRLAITDSIITGNQAREGGALEIQNTATIANSSISDNRAIEGGGILVASDHAVLHVTDSAMISNKADFGGAVVVRTGGSLTVTNSTLARNSALVGAAINEGIPPDATLPIPPGKAVIQNSTIVDNTVRTAVFFGHSMDSREGTIEVRSSIIAGTTPSERGDCPIAISLGFNLIENPIDCSRFLINTDIVGDPRLRSFVDDGSPGHAYFPLSPASPAIDAGGDAPKHPQGWSNRSWGARPPSPADCFPADQIGQPRVGRCDIGAIEFLSDRVRVGDAKYDTNTKVLFVSARSSAEEEDVNLFVSVAGCVTGTPMLRLDTTHLLLTQIDCGNLENSIVTVTSSAGGVASARIRLILLCYKVLAT